MNSKNVTGAETILIVEDEPDLREMERGILENCGYRVLGAASGPEALNLWNEQAGKIDLLLADIVLPNGISGIELAKRLRVSQPQLKVIFASGRAAGELDQEMLAKRKALFLQKPYQHTDLIAAVRDAFTGTRRSGVTESLS